jgi:hypothetical protein
MGNMPPSEPGASGAGSGPDWENAKAKLQAARGADRMILIAAFVLFIDSFLPWVGLTRSTGLGRFTASGWRSGGLAVLPILLGIVAGIFALIRVLGVKMDIGTLRDGVVYLVLGLGALLFTLLRWITIPQFFSARYGLFVAIVATAFLAYGGWMKNQGRS